MRQLWQGQMIFFKFVKEILNFKYPLNQLITLL